MATNPPKAAAKATTQAATTDKKTYTVKTVVNHDDDLYDIGSTIDLTDKQAEPLLAVDAIAAPDSEGQA